MRMKRLICALLAGLLALSASAMAAGRLTEATMIYEDYDGQRCEQTVVDNATLKEIQDMLERAAKNKGTLENCTMNSTLFCYVGEKIYDFAVAPDGCPYIVNLDNNVTYRLSDEDRERLWEIFDLVQETMGYDAALVLDW